MAIKILGIQTHWKTNEKMRIDYPKDPDFEEDSQRPF